ncbi:amidohydrolase 2 [Dactylonectria macrodidyma]|uniref:Amidohydrolase 2 n=1 Tax=Dactylonectria macrodidyma TaxID=307937 RepID=A0A9P9ISL5_9HYPO|nr:amidohydrolase 2 [Dactylonectria macrodidyma]
MRQSITIAFGTFVASAIAKTWNNTGKGSIIFEEAFSLEYPELERTIGSALPGQTYADLLTNLADIHNQRLRWMDETGVDYMVLSLTSPGIQGISDVRIAERVATQANDDIAATISNNTVRFGAFAALSMHNATQAALELRRCVEELGFHGALLNDFQQAGVDNNTLYYYDAAEYDVFWQMAVDLDVPVYLHPRPPTPLMRSTDFAHAPWMLGPAHQFAVTLSNHIVGLCTNGVFDRFPSLKVIVGHLGERLPSDFWRIDEMLARRVREGIPMKRPFSSYWRTNIWETTTGNFWTDLLEFHRSVLGEDRVLYSVDYPFIMMQQGAEWVKTLKQSKSSEQDFIRNHAIKLLKLDA